MKARKTRVRKHVIADMSLHHLSYIIATCTFTVEPTRADYGYDISVFTFDDAGRYENGNIFVQLKATDKIRISKINGLIEFRLSKRDIATWEDEPFPVYLVVFDAASRRSYSLYVQRYLRQIGITSSKLEQASIRVYLENVDIDEGTVNSWRRDKQNVLDQMNAVTHV